VIVPLIVGIFLYYLLPNIISPRSQPLVGSTSFLNKQNFYKDISSNIIKQERILELANVI